MRGVIDSFMEKGEAGASVDPVGCVRVYMVSELVLWSLHLRRKGRVHNSLVLLVPSILSRMCRVAYL
jgi:hypothetical protein